MVRTSKEKKDFVINLMAQGFSYDQIQKALQDKFETGMSNTTLQKFRNELEQISILKQQVERLEEEVKIWKTMYFELKEATVKSLKRSKK